MMHHILLTGIPRICHLGVWEVSLLEGWCVWGTLAPACIVKHSVACYGDTITSNTFTSPPYLERAQPHLPGHGAHGATADREKKRREEGAEREEEEESNRHCIILHPVHLVYHYTIVQRAIP
jgi:hypothetical protein